MESGKPKLGLALGSGGARGLAHIGVLHALTEAGIIPDIVAGASIGSLVGGVYAAGKLEELTDIALGLNWKRTAYYFMEVSLPRSGLIGGAKVTDFLAKIVGDREIADLPVTFRAVATEIMNGREVVIAEGGLVPAIRASIAVPGIFTPARLAGDLLVDGGLVNPVPVSVCRALGAERIIAVELNQGRIKDTRPPEVSGDNEVGKAGPRAGGHAREMFDWLERKTGLLDAGFLEPVRAWMEREPMPSIFDVLGNSLRIMEGQIAATRLKIDRPDLLIRPRVGHVHFMEFHLAEETIAEGYRSSREALEQGSKTGIGL